MRIIAGALGGRRLAAPRGEGCRPAMDRTREALFSMLEARLGTLADRPVLDLFAGSGSLAFEALSRGAPLAVLVDNSGPALDCIRSNAAALRLEDRTRILRGDVLRLLRGKPAHAPFGLVFLDPPYRRALAAPALAALTRGAWLAPGAVVVAELEADLAPPAVPGLEPLGERGFGQTRIHLWRACSPDTAPDGSHP